MIELKGVEADRRGQYDIAVDENVELNPGDEVLLMVTKPSGHKHEEYGIPLRITNGSEPDEDEFLIKYGDKLFVAQKIPEFI